MKVHKNSADGSIAPASQYKRQGAGISPFYFVKTGHYPLLLLINMYGANM